MDIGNNLEFTTEKKKQDQKRRGIQYCQIGFTKRSKKTKTNKQIQQYKGTYEVLQKLSPLNNELNYLSMANRWGCNA